MFVSLFSSSIWIRLCQELLFYLFTCIAFRCVLVFVQNVAFITRSTPTKEKTKSQNKKNQAGFTSMHALEASIALFMAARSAAVGMAPVEGRLGKGQRSISAAQAVANMALPTRFARRLAPASILNSTLAIALSYASLEWVGPAVRGSVCVCACVCMYVCVCVCVCVYVKFWTASVAIFNPALLFLFFLFTLKKINALHTLIWEMKIRCEPKL